MGIACIPKKGWGANVIINVHYGDAEQVVQSLYQNLFQDLSQKTTSAWDESAGYDAAAYPGFAQASNGFVKK